jgi:hypothetical protein
MGSRSKLDSSILLEFFPRWKIARESKSRTQAGEVFSELQSLTGLSKATLHRLFDKWLKGENLLNIAERKSIRQKNVVSEIELEHRKKVALTISALQKASDIGKNGKPISRQRAIEIAIASGHLTEEDVKHHSTIGRWQTSLGISTRQLKQNTRQERSAKHIDYKFANNVWSLDATVWDGYFLNLAKWTFEKRPATLTKGDNHELDYMAKNQLAKVWIYYGVDCFSGLFWARAFIPTKSEAAKYGGENSTDMLEFINELFLSKKEIEISDEIYTIFGQGANNIKQMPLEGRPNHILVDNGSPCNTRLRGFLTRLGIAVDTHMPGNPRAKKAESIISASKRAIENSLNLLTRAKIGSIEKLNYFLQASIYNYCQNNGQIQKFLKSCLDYPIKSLSLTNLRDALVEHRPRKTNKYGEVSVAWDRNSGSQVYYVGQPGQNIPVGTEVHVYRDVDGNVCAQNIQTLEIYKCGLSVRDNSTEYGEFVGHTDSEADKLRKVVDIESVRIKRSIDITHVISTPKPIIQFPARSVNTESSSIVPPEFFQSVEEAKTYIVMQSGVGFNDLPEKLSYAIEHSLESIFTATGQIESSFVVLCVNKIRTEINLLKQKIGG